MLALNAVWTTSSCKLQFVQVHGIWNSDIIEFQISQGGNSLFFPPTTTNIGLLPLSTNGWHPPSLNKWPYPPSLDEWLVSSLSQQTAGILPLLMNSCPSTFDNGLVLPLANGLPCLNKQLPPSFDEWPPPSLDKWLPPLADSLKDQHSPVNSMVFPVN